MGRSCKAAMLAEVKGGEVTMKPKAGLRNEGGGRDPEIVIGMMIETEKGGEGIIGTVTTHARGQDQGQGICTGGDREAEIEDATPSAIKGGTYVTARDPEVVIDIVRDEGTRVGHGHVRLPEIEEQTGKSHES